METLHELLNRLRSLDEVWDVVSWCLWCSSYQYLGEGRYINRGFSRGGMDQHPVFLIFWTVNIYLITRYFDVEVLGMDFDPSPKMSKKGSRNIAGVVALLGNSWGCFSCYF
jgi:hypothetical protein